jgi:SAM-dependent methyltransferase
MERGPKSNIEWLWWGQTDPLYGVCSVLGKSRSNREPWTEEAFYATAVEEFATNLRHWTQYGLVAESCVEIGCGAGRMTRRLETTFSVVHACDISPGMLELVEKNCNPNIVKRHLCDGATIPLPDECVTAAYSTIVFQHFVGPELGIRYFREIYRVLKPGGTFMINLPWHQYPNAILQWPYRLANRFARAYDRWSAGRRRLLINLGPAVMKTRIGMHFGELMDRTSYDFPWLIGQLEGIGFRDIEVHSYYVPIEGRHHPFFFGTK